MNSDFVGTKSVISVVMIVRIRNESELCSLSLSLSLLTLFYCLESRIVNEISLMQNRALGSNLGQSELHVQFLPS